MASGTLSTLPHPFLYYLAIATAALGLYLAATGILGCWASCLHNFYILTFVSYLLYHKNKLSSLFVFCSVLSGSGNNSNRRMRGLCLSYNLAYVCRLRVRPWRFGKKPSEELRCCGTRAVHSCSWFSTSQCKFLQQKNLLNQWWIICWVVSVLWNRNCKWVWHFTLGSSITGTSVGCTIIMLQTNEF